jgi:hypothetical protein
MVSPPPGGKVDDPDVKDEIIRCLSVPWIGSKATAQLIEEFDGFERQIIAL